MKKITIFCLLSFALISTAYGAQPSKIELIDGSVINGEIISYLNDVYTINTATFGEVKIKATKVSKIESANYALPNTTISPIVQTNNLAPTQLSAYGQKLMENPDNAAIFKGLTNDTGLQEMAKDPQIQNAAQTGDIQTLLKNPKFMNIVNSPEIQEAVKKLKQ